MQNVTIKHENVDVILDFHVFDVQDFDLMIGHPIEKLLMDAPTQGKIDVRLGKETFSVQISRAANSLAEPSLDSEPIMEVMCNTRFIKGHKPSNHICARIKSHIYTTE